MGVLLEIELENFKSYKGKHRIGPFKTFSAVIGPNGSGKSNLMDAICFVLGEKTSTLRVKKISDLIHGAPTGKPVSTRCHVSLIYQHDDGRAQTFSRMVMGANAEYRVDNKVVTLAQYTQELERLNIFIKAKNCLVFQGTVESLAMKTSKERALLFEEISRSNELKEEYDRLKAEKEAKLEKDEAEKYQRMKDLLAEKQLKLHLFKLFHNERESKVICEELEKKRGDLNKIDERRAKLEEQLKEKKKEHGKLNRELGKVEQQIHELDADLNKKKPNFIKVKENVRHTERKLEAIEKALTSAKRTAESQQDVVNHLQEDLKKCLAEREEYEAALRQDSQREGLQLNDTQLSEYHKLKGEVAKQCAQYQQDVDVLDREQQMDQDVLDNEKRRRVEYSTKISQKQQELEATRKRVERLVDQLESNKRQIAEQTEIFNKTKEEVENAKNRLEVVTLEVNKLNNQLQEANVDTSESSRMQRKQELVESLKRISTGIVYGRLVDLCQPSHKRYQLAVTKVLGKNMNAIIVDTQKTAHDCIQYMKEQRIEQELFLALDYIDVKPTNEQLRSVKSIINLVESTKFIFLGESCFFCCISYRKVVLFSRELREPRGVKLVIDVIQFDPPQIKRALQFACGNALVCETAEDARKLAFVGTQRHKVIAYYDELMEMFQILKSFSSLHCAVSLDGTLFQKSGIISGGTSELRAKARRWDEKAVSQLRTQKAALVEEQKELHRIRRKEGDVGVAENTIKQLETRVKYMAADKDKTVMKINITMLKDNLSLKESQVKQLERDLLQLKAESDNFEPRLLEIENRMSERAGKSKSMQDEMNKAADKIFARFCSKLGVNNIRQYEDREVKFQQEKKKKLLDYDRQIGKLRGEIEFNKSEDKNTQLSKMSEAYKKEEKDLAKLKKEEQQQIKIIEEGSKKMEDLKMQRVSKKNALEEKEAELNEMKKQLAIAQKDTGLAQKQTAALETKLESKKSERHSLLQTCKVEDIKLPMSRGSAVDIVDDSESSTQASSSQDFSTQATKEIYEKEAKIKINYGRLDADLKQIESDDEIEKVSDRLLKEVTDMQHHLQTISAPNLRATEKLEDVKGRLAETAEEFEQTRRKAKKVKIAFEKIRKERCDRFNKCFNHVSGIIDEIYKALSRNMSAQAYLVPENTDEPYLEGITFNCVAPGKRYRQMDNLSGGEKTIAALSLLFAMHSFNSAPFFVLDEIDAALDNTNIGKVAAFIREQCDKHMQIIVISLKEEFYNRADALIGVYPTTGPCMESGILSLDLTKYKDLVADEE
uniref:Structural maintenance of chromosomes protein n=1 Tax=Romanomermis culicivorax TaxID=13658 RepID=A0A915I2X7_ROMCU